MADLSLKPNAIEEPSNAPISRGEFNALRDQVFILNKTLEGMQQLFIKAGEYQGKPRGRLPR